MATPHVAGVAALMLARNPTLTPDQVEAKLKASVRAFPVACTVGCGTGILDANLAVDAAGLPAVTNVAEVEANNTLATAQKITTVLPSTVSGAVSASTDADYYSVTVPAGGRVIAKLTGNTSSNYDLYAFNGAGTQLASSVLTGTGVDGVTVNNIGTVAMTVVLQVKYVSGLTGTAGTYKLALSRY
jgi:serine protease